MFGGKEMNDKDQLLALQALKKQIDKIKESDTRIEKLQELIKLKEEIDTTNGRVSELDEQIAMVEEHITLAEEYITLEEEHITLEEEHKNTLHELQIENNKNTIEIATKIVDELEKIKSSGLELLGKKELKKILDYKDDETYYRFMRRAVRDGYAMKLGKGYKITVKNLEKFLKHKEGQNYEF